jgi:hypothetical protein
MRTIAVVLVFLLAGCASRKITGGQITVGETDLGGGNDGLWKRRERSVLIREELLGGNPERVQQVVEHELGHVLMGGQHTRTGLMSSNGKGWEVTPAELRKVDPNASIQVLCTDDPTLRAATKRAVDSWNRRLGRRVFR